MPVYRQKEERKQTLAILAHMWGEHTDSKVRIHPLGRDHTSINLHRIGMNHNLTRMCRLAIKLLLQVLVATGSNLLLHFTRT